MSKLEKIIMEYPYKMEKEFLQDKKLGPDIIEINDKIYREQKSLDRKFSWFLLGLVLYVYLLWDMYLFQVKKVCLQGLFFW